MVGAERKNFETLKSLDRRKWHFQTERKLIQAGKKSNCEKNHCGGKLSFKTQLKIEYLLPYTGSRKLLENITALI